MAHQLSHKQEWLLIWKKSTYHHGEPLPLGTGLFFVTYHQLCHGNQIILRSQIDPPFNKVNP